MNSPAPQSRSGREIHATAAPFLIHTAPSEARDSRETGRLAMQYLLRAGDQSSLLGDLVVLGFLIVQGLDGAFTYLGVSLWGAGIEANPIVSAAVNVAGLGPGLAGAKLVAVGFGIALHLWRAH